MVSAQPGHHPLIARIHCPRERWRNLFISNKKHCDSSSQDARCLSAIIGFSPSLPTSLGSPDRFRRPFEFTATFSGHDSTIEHIRQRPHNDGCPNHVAPRFYFTRHLALRHLTWDFVSGRLSFIQRHAIIRFYDKRLASIQHPRQQQRQNASTSSPLPCDGITCLIPQNKPNQNE